MGRSVTGSSSGNTFLTTVSPIGFSAGDPVYVTSNGVGRISDSYTGAITFTGLAPQAYQAPQSSPDAGPLRYVENYGGMTNSNAVAVLTNGNVVIAYGKRANATSSNTYIYFKILDTSDNVVVAETTVSTTGNYINAGGPIGCLALPNGNFVVIWHGFTGGSRRLSYAIYGPTGSVVTAVTADTTVLLGVTTRQVVFDARSDSSFVVASFNDVDQPFYRVISSTGTIIYSGTFGSTAVSANRNNTISVTVRSDNSFGLFYCNPNTASGMQWQIFSSTNVSQGSGTYLGGGNPQLVDGVFSFLQPTDVIGFVVRNPNYFSYCRLTGTTLGSQRDFNFSGYGSGAEGFSAGKFGSDGRFVFTFSFQSTASKLQYRVCDALGNNVLASGSAKFINCYSQGAFAQPVLVGNEMRFYKSSISTPTSAPARYPKGIYYFKLDATTYAQTPFSFINAPAAFYSLGASGYARGGSSVTKAAFLAASSTTSTTTLGPTTTTTSSFLLPPTSLNVTVVAYSLTSLQNGDLAVAYQVGTTTNPTIYLAIYDRTGVQKTLLTVATGTSQTWLHSVRVIQLSNGKIVVVYREPSGSNLLFYKIYTSSYALFYSSASVDNNVAGYDNVAGAAPLDGSNFAISWTNGSAQARVKVFNETGTQLTDLTGDGSVGNTWVCGSRNGDFVFASANNGSASNMRLIAKDNANNTWGQAASITFNIGSTWARNYPQFSPPTTPDNFSIFQCGDAANANVQYFTFVSSPETTLPVTYTGDTFFTTAGYTPSLGVTGNGDFVSFATDTGTVRYARIWGTAAETYLITTSYQSLGATCTSSVGISSSPYIGDSVAIIYPSATNVLTMAILYANSTSFTTTITAGSSISNPIALTYNGGYSFLGVAVTDCPPGGTGVVQTSGSAVLSQTYESVSSQYFDFRNNTTYGTSGVVSGRTVAMGV